MTERPYCLDDAHTTWNLLTEQTKAVGEQEYKDSALLHRGAETDPLTSICCLTSSVLIDREEKVAFANCPQNPRARRIFTFQAVSLLLIFQSSSSPCQFLTDTRWHFSLNAMCKRLFNDSGQCLSGHLGVTGAHTLVGGADHLGAQEAFWQWRSSIRVQQFRLI